MYVSKPQKRKVQGEVSVESTYRTIELRVKQIKKHFGKEKPVSKIGAGEIEGFLQAFKAEKTQWVKEGRNAHTVNHLRTWLVQFFKFCQALGEREPGGAGGKV